MKPCCASQHKRAADVGCGASKRHFAPQKNSNPFRYRTTVKSVTDVPIRARYPLDPTEGPMAINFARRKFIAALGGAIGAWSLAARAAARPHASRWRTHGRWDDV